MTDGLAPDELKQQHKDAIDQCTTFKTEGVSTQAAKDYLDTPDGQKYTKKLVEADSRSSLLDIRNRAVNQIISGRELPRMEVSNEPLEKIVPAGSKVSAYSPFFAKQSAFEDALSQGHNLSERFGLPIVSEAARYDVYKIQPKAATEVFVSHVAPTSELGGRVNRPGGAEQYLVPNRGLYTDPTYVKSLDNSLVLQTARSASAGVASPAANAGVRNELDAAQPLPPAPIGPSAPAGMRPRLDEPAHPDHPLYQQASRAVDRIDAQIHHPHDLKSDNLSAAVAVAARDSGLQRIDHVVMSDDGSKAFAVQGNPQSPDRKLAHPVDTAQAIQTSIAHSTVAMDQATQRQQQPSQMAAVQSVPQVQQQQGAPYPSR